MQLTAAERQQSAESILACQRADGLIEWYPGGHADPWNHVEAAMALDIAECRAEARRAYEWLASHQLEDGSWFQYYAGEGVEDQKKDANTIAYLGTGLLHHHLAANDVPFLIEMWPTLQRAIDWVLTLQQPTGEIIWCREADGSVGEYALLTGSSSMVHSITSAHTVSVLVGSPRQDWADAAEALAAAVSDRPDLFEPKHRWAMDWYYPVLAGVLRSDRAESRMRAAWDRFVIGGEGVRCVDDHPWVTTGETAEAAIACVVAGMTDDADLLMRWIRQLRHTDGSYWTGLHVPDRVHFPAGERTTYSTAAVLLADDCLYGVTSASTLFR
jgi:Prenyltransferase and squalene oxidase repeat